MYRIKYCNEGGKEGEAEISYLLKRVTRTWTVFVALLLSIALASTFFAGVNVGADTVAKQVLDNQLNQIPVDMRVRFGSILAADNFTGLIDEIHSADIEEVSQCETISKLYEAAVLPDSNETSSDQAYFQVAGIMETSRVYDGVTVTDGSPSLGANETFVWAASDTVEDLDCGEILRFNMTVKWFQEDLESPRVKTLLLNLTVVGFVDLEEQAREILGVGGQYDITASSYPYYGNLLLVDWNKTVAPVIDAYYDESLSPEGWFYGHVDTEILIFLDREAVINPWDIDSSTERLRTIASQIRNMANLFTREWVYVDSPLEYLLNSYRWTSQAMRLQFIITSIPVFFIAWYMGSTVSDVSYNLRRREIGLLLTKGFSRRQLLRMFLAEAFLVGGIGGSLGAGLSVVLTPFFIQGVTLSAVTPVIGVETIIITLVFSVGLTVLAVFQPARRASQLNAVDALQEYRYVEEVKAYKRRWPWIAFSLGTYKIATWLLGINLFTVTTGSPPVSNILLLLLLGVWIFVDTYILNYVGPLLFFWGVTKIFIRGSLRFQEVVAKLVKVAGDLSALATKNVRRNPARTAAVAFLIALIIGYSFQVTGSYASEQDYIIRQVKFTVGADVSIQLNTLEDLSSTVEKIENMSDVTSTTVEVKFWHSTDDQYMSFVAVNPNEWLNIAYYENAHFTGEDVASAFQAMKNDNYTVILEQRIAETLNLQVGDQVAVVFGTQAFNLRVVGFFGVQPSTPLYRYNPVSYWSYIPEGFYEIVKNEVSPNGKILVKTAADAEGKAVAEEIRSYHLNGVSAVYSVEESLEGLRENPFEASMPLAFLGLAGATEIQRLGIAFAIVAASIGAALITLVSLKERSKEVGLMSVRGLSFKQVVGVLLTENLAVVGFAVCLGAVVGLVVVHGNIAAANSMPMSLPGPTPGPLLEYSFSPVLRRMVFPLDALLTLAACCILVFASTIIPVLFTARKYISQLERIVREA